MGLDEGGISEFQIEREFQEVASFEPITYELIYFFRVTRRDIRGIKTALKQKHSTGGLP
jgi:hypothetical protein